MIIGITGKKGSGKDECYKIIKELVPHAERRAFADKLKESAAALLGVEKEWLDDHKFDKHTSLEFGQWEWIDDEDGNGFFPTGIIGLSIRQFLQRYGTEAHREIFGQDFWLKQCLPDDDISKLYYVGLHRIENTSVVIVPEPLIVITDVRFDNEAEWILNLGGLVWEVTRPSMDDGDTHPSEIPVHPGLIQFHLVNDGILDDLKTKVKGMIDANYNDPVAARR